MADKWGGVEVDHLDSFTTRDGDRVTLVDVPAGTPLVVFAYQGHPTQIIQYAVKELAREAFDFSRSICDVVTDDAEPTNHGLDPMVYPAD